MLPRDSIFFFSIRGKYFAYDINSTIAIELDDVALSVLPEILSGNSEDLENKYAHLYPKLKIHKCIKECRDLLHSCNFGTQNSFYRHHIRNDISAVCLHIAHDCNLRCKYCYADTGTFGGKRLLMSHQVMKKAIDFTFEHSGNTKSVNIGFFGGEPLLNFKLIHEAVEYSKKRANILKKRVTFSLASNATLLTNKIMDFLNGENFSLLYSLDGPRQVHNKMRITKNGIGTHSLVLKKIKKYARDYSEDFTVRGTFTRTTPNFSEQVSFLNSQGFKSISVEPAQLSTDNPHTISTDADMQRILFEYDKMADIYLDAFRKGKPLHFFHFDYFLKKLLYPAPEHTECGAGSGFIAVTPDGNIFPCFEAVAEKDNVIGNINSSFDIPKRKVFQRMHVDAKEECKKCWIKYFCGGGCHAFNIRYNHDIHVPYEPQCEFIKYRFKLAVWLLSEIRKMGEKEIAILEKHVGINNVKGTTSTY